jgi:hypothetical protein
VVGHAAADARSTGGESGREVVKEKVADNESNRKELTPPPSNLGTESSEIKLKALYRGVSDLTTFLGWEGPGGRGGGFTGDLVRLFNPRSRRGFFLKIKSSKLKKRRR